MTSELPLKVRVDIRDLWESPKSDVHASIASLEATLGHKIEPMIEWTILWNELKDRYPDKATFVPSISRVVNAWYSRLLWRLDSENYPEWTEELLHILSNGRKQLVIEPARPPHDCPKTMWNFKTSSFYLVIPNLEPPQHSKVVAAFDQDFDDLFKEKTAGPTEEGWDDLAANPSRSALSDEQPKVDRMPRLGELSRPKELFTTTAPYILTLDMGNPLVIRCSHEPTLELLSSYFNRWGKQSVHDTQRNVYDVELVESSFCNGLNDALIVEPFSTYLNKGPVNPTLLLAFIEGVLGYKMVHTTGHNWVYRSTTIFK